MLATPFRDHFVVDGTRNLLGYDGIRNVSWGFVEGWTETGSFFNVFCKDRVQQGSVEQNIEPSVEIIDVPVPQMMEQLGDVPRIQRRTAEQIVDMPVPKVVEECLQGFLSGQGYSMFCRAEHRISRG